MDDVIRDLAKAHGHENLTDGAVKQVKSKLSNAYIDQILDTGKEPAVSPAPPPAPTGSSGGDGGE